MLGRLAARHCGRIADRRDVAAIAVGLAALEYGGAGDQHIGAGTGDGGGVLRGDAAVDLDVDRPPARERRDAGDLVGRMRR